MPWLDEHSPAVARAFLLTTYGEAGQSGESGYCLQRLGQLAGSLTCRLSCNIGNFQIDETAISSLASKQCLPAVKIKRLLLFTIVNRQCTL